MVEHNEIDAIYYCEKCEIYMCYKCEKYHSELFKNNNKHRCNQNKIKDDLFIDLCLEKNHLIDFQYFCKTHNKLCCAKCITKIKNKENGQHTNCVICTIEDIEKEKKLKLKENIKSLEDLSIDLEQNIKELIKISEKIQESKETSKIKIQKIFTNLRNSINNKEDELLLEIDKKFNDIYFDENTIKKYKKFPNTIKNLLKKGKLIIENWKNNNKLNKIINDCLEIEKFIEDLNKMKEKLSQYKSINTQFNIFSNNELENQILKFIKQIEKINLKRKIFNTEIDIDEDLVKTWLNNKNLNAELLFRKTRDGSTSHDFHEKCDNKGNTITFIETTKGYKFGIYTELQWDCSCSYKYDESTFVFSLNKKKKYMPKNNQGRIYCNPYNGPRVGEDEIFFFTTLDNGSINISKNNYFLSENELTDGEKEWKVKELEVFKITYI